MILRTVKSVKICMRKSWQQGLYKAHGNCISFLDITGTLSLLYYKRIQLNTNYSRESSSVCCGMPPNPLVRLSMVKIPM